MASAWGDSWGAAWGDSWGVRAPPSGGKGDNHPDRQLLRVPFKPTGLIDRPRAKGRKDVEARIEDSSAIQAEVARKLALEFGAENAATLARQQALEVAELTARQVDFEIGVLLRKKLRTEEEEVLLLLLMVAAVA